MTGVVKVVHQGGFDLDSGRRTELNTLQIVWFSRYFSKILFKIRLPVLLLLLLPLISTSKQLSLQNGADLGVEEFLDLDI